MHFKLSVVLNTVFMLRLCEELKEEGVERHLLLLHTKHKKFDSCFSFHPTHLKTPNGNKSIQVNHSLHSTYTLTHKGNCFGKRNKGGHTLGGNTATSTTPGSSQSPTQQQQGSSQRDAMLAAAERRRQEVSDISMLS